MDRKTLGANAAAMVCIMVWGTTFIVSKNLMEFLSPLQLMCVRFAVAYVALWFLRPEWNFSVRSDLMFLLMAVFGNTLYFIAENTALTYTYSSNVSILVSSTPMMALLLVWIFGAEAVRGKQIIGFVIAFAGVVLVVMNGAFVLEIAPTGDLLSLGAALSWAIYGMFLRKVTGRYNSFLISRKIMFYGLLTVLPLVMIEGKTWDLDSLFSIESILGLLFLGVIGSSLCYVFWNDSIKKLGVIRSNLYLYAMPLVTMVAGAVAFNENITFMAVGGTLLIIFGMAFSNRSERRSADASAEEQKPAE